MSNNPQWKSFQPPPINSDSSILDYKTMTINSNSSFHSSPNGTSYSGNNSQYSGLQSSPKDIPNNMFASKASSSNMYSAQYNNPYPSPNNSRGSNGGGGGSGSGGGSGGGGGRFPIGTFSVNDGGSSNVYNGEAVSSPPSGNANNASNSNYNDSALNNQGTRETGIIEKLLHSYGFIQCCERQARLFFHFSQFNGNIEHLKIGDPVEFEMTYDRRTGKPIASAVTKIAPEVVLSEERVTGTVTTELRAEGSGGDTQGRISYENRGECFFLPYNKDDVEGNVTLRSGDKVSFQIATNQRSGNLGACHIRLENPAHPVKYQGVICSMKESFGFIERADVVKEIFFHFSEAKSLKDELRLGDDVEFTIQTRNGKEVACGITRLEPGSVVFEDVCSEVVKGQVLKPLERTQQARQQHQSDPLPGRIRYRAPDHSEVEVPFGDKDQRGDFTLKHGDWVQFRIATDRRDQLQRATNISLLEESFSVSGERREQGAVVALKEGFGFIRCAERESRLFFHFNEVLDVDRDICLNDEVEFTVVQEQTSFSNSRQSAIRIKHLPAGTVQFEVMVERGVSGVVSKEGQLPGGWSSRSPTKSSNQSPANTTEKSGEPGVIQYQTNGTKKSLFFLPKDCDPKNLPRVGDKVEFNICQVKRSKELVAVDVKVVSKSTTKNGVSRANNLPLYQGFIAALKDGFGFIETVAHDREVFFHFSNLEGDSEKLELGEEVEYNLGTRGSSGSCMSAENVRVLPRGTIDLPPVEGEALEGTVVRPLRSVNPDQSQYAGLVQAAPKEDEEQGAEYEFGITGLQNKRELLQVGDPVTFQVDASGRAANIVAVRKKRRATVDAVKGLFGFLAYEVDEGKKLFFHMSEVKDGASLQPGDQVEFVLVTNQRTGKSSACNVTKVSDAAKQERPERLISRLRTISLEEAGPKLILVRQPKGPDGTNGFLEGVRQPRLPGAVPPAE